METTRPISILKSAILAILLMLIFFFIKYVFQFQFGGYDLSPVIDLCTRLNKGQIPGKDFISTFPISYIFWLKISLLVFQNKYDFLIYAGYVHFLVCIAFIYGSIRQSKQLYTFEFLILGLLIISIPELVINFIFHAPFSQFNCIVLFLTVAIIITNTKISRFNYLTFFLFAGLCLFSKQNIGLFCIALCGGALITCYVFKLISLKELLLSAITFISGIIIFMLLVHAVLMVDYTQFITMFTIVAGRGLPARDQINEVFVHNLPSLILSFISVLFSLIVFFKCLKINKMSVEFKILFAFITLIQVVGYFTYLTDWDTKFNDFPVVGFTTLMMLTIILLGDVALRKIYGYVIIALVLYSGLLGVKRYRMEMVGEGTFYQSGPLRRLNGSYLDGVYCGSRLFKINNEINTLKADDSLPTKTFFGPRMEFGYTQYKVPSPEHMPLWWHPGSSYNMKDEKKVITTFETLNFTELIFLKKDRTRMPDSLISYIKINYHDIKKPGELDILRHN